MKNNSSTLTDVIKGCATTKQGITFVNSSKDEYHVSYSEIYKCSLSIMSELKLKGIIPGQEIVLQIEDNEKFIKAFWACILGGYIVVPLSVGYLSENLYKLSVIRQQLHNPILLTENSVFTKLISSGINENDLKFNIMNIEDFPKGNNFITPIYEADEQDVAFIQYSSGSTGNPKGVVVTHQNLICNINAIIQSCSISTEDKLLSWTPLTHDLGMILCHLVPVFAKVPLIMIPTALFIKGPTIWLNKASDHKATILVSPNFGFQFLLNRLKRLNSHPNWDLSSIRRIYNGAEPISYEICNNFIDELSPFGLDRNVITPAYGLAEATLAVTFAKNLSKIFVNRDSIKVGQPVKLENSEQDQTMSLVNVGSAVDQVNIRICDDTDNMLPNCYIGHLQISGPSVTTGYYNNVKDTEELYTGSWLKTGDTGLIVDSNLYIVGRSKDLIIINGLNYYCHDIERVIFSDSQFELNKVVVSGVNNLKSDKEEVVVFLKHPINKEFVKKSLYIKELVNSKMALNITEVVPVKKIYKTTSGKIQRFRMAELYEEDFFSDVLEKVKILTKEDENNLRVRNEKAFDDVEQKVVNIWREHLNIDVDLDTNFLGGGVGDSLTAAMITAEIESHFNISIPLNHFFSNKTPRDISDWIKKQKVTNQIVHSNNEVVINRYSNNISISSAEKRMVIINNFEKQDTNYNVPWYVEVNCELDKKRFGEALSSLVERHESLRTSFEWNNGQLIKKVQDNIKLPLSYLTLENIDPDSIMETFIIPFELSIAPLFRIMVAETKLTNKFHIFGDFHHIIADRISITIFLRELLFLIQGENKSKDLSPIVSSRNLMVKSQSEKKTKREKEYWLNYLSGELPTINLPYDFNRSEQNTRIGHTINFLINSEVTSKIKSLAEKSSSTMFMIILSFYNILLSKLARQEEVVVGAPISIRKHGDNRIGIFINTIVFRSYPNGNKSYNQYLNEIREMSIQHYENKELAFNELVNILKVSRSSNRNPIFDTMLIYNNHRFDNSVNGSVKVPISYDSKTSKFDMTLEITETKNGLDCKFNYNSSLFNETKIVKFIKYFKNIINYVVNNPNDLISNIEYMDESELKKIIMDFNQTNHSVPQSLFIDQLIEKQSELYPEQKAIVHEHKSTTYKELNDQATVLANQLQANNVGPGDVIPLIVERSTEMIIGILGILKTGAAYLPIDSEYPKDRVHYMIKQSDSSILLTDWKNSLLESIQGEKIQLEHLTLIKKQSITKSIQTPKRKQTDLAYIIYTSGSTGNPKGVMIEHKSIVNLFYSLKNSIPFHKRSAMLNLTTISFDIFIVETLFPLALGKKVVITNQVSNSKNIGDIVLQEKIDIIQFTPSRLKVILDSEYDKSWLNNIKDIMIGGESLNEDILYQLQRLTNAQIYNVYGPTESTVWSTLEVITDLSMNIGKPLYNTHIYILDNNLNPVPIGVTGDIYISGDGLARGYYKQEELSDSSFINISFPFIGMKRIYKTGDLGAWSNEGKIKFLGRVDNQIKLRGFRIEPNEIRKNLLKHENINDAIITFNKDSNNGNDYICAYVIQYNSHIEINYADFLSLKLPNYMIPSFFIPIDSVPLTPNGKLNGKILPKIEDINFKKDNIDLPKTEIEEKIYLIWSKVLNKPVVGTTEDFFQIGGSSIQAIKLEAEIEKEITPIQEMFVYNFKTIQQQASVIEKLLKK